MRKPGTNPDDVQMSDVLCDFCRRQWTDEVPMIEGHHGSCICGRCMTVAYSDVVLHSRSSAPADYTCTMCLEANSDRAAENRPDHIGWQSPMYEDAVICRRCIKLGAGALHKDADSNWSKPTL
jgi:hypothetical protein